MDVATTTEETAALADRLKRQVTYAQALARCSGILMQAPASVADRQDILNRALEPLRVAAQACRAYIFENFEDPDDGFCSGIRAEAHAPDAAAHLHRADTQKIPWAMAPARNRERLARGEPVGGSFGRVFAGYPQIQAWLRQLDIESVLYLPIFVEGQWWGYAGYEECDQPREWSADDVALLEAAAEMLGSAIHRWQTADLLEAQVRYQKALAHCSTVLLKNPEAPEARTRLLESALESLLWATDASRAYYYQCFEDPDLGPYIGIAALVGIPGIPNAIPERSRKVPRSTLGSVWLTAFDRREPLGGPIGEIFAADPEWRDRYLQQQPPLLSAQVVPLFIDDVQWGFVGLDDVKTPRRWTEAEITLLRTAGEIVGSALQRWDVNETLEEQVRSRTAELQESNRRLQRRLDLEQMFAQVSSRLLRHDGSDETWRAALRDLGEAAGAPALLFVRPTVPGAEPQSILWRQSLAPLDAGVLVRFPTACPWIWQQAAQGAALHFPALDALPPEASADRRFLDAAGVSSLSLFPMLEEDATAALVAFWPQQPSSPDADVEDRRILQLGANLIESRLRVERALETLEQRLVARTSELAAYFDISMLASKAETLTDLLLPAAEQIARIGQCQAVCIHLLGQDAEGLTLAAHVGLTDAEADSLADLSAFTPALLELTVQRAIAARVDQPTLIPTPLWLPGYESCFCGRLQVRGRPIGLLSAYRRSAAPFNIDDVSLLTALSELLAIVVENHRLYLDAQRAAIEVERQRMARELHDSITQLLYGQTIFARTGQYALEDRDEAKLRESLDLLERGALTALKEMRLLLFSLRPLALEGVTLAGAIQRRFDDVENRLRIQTEIDIAHEDAFDAETRFELYRIIMEALNNSLKHADASAVRVWSEDVGDCCRVTAADNGAGFDPERVARGLGLVNMAERAASIQATLHVTSRPGEGAQVVVDLPRRFG